MAGEPKEWSSKSSSSLLLGGKEASLSSESRKTTSLSNDANFIKLKQLQRELCGTINLNKLFVDDAERFNKYR